MAKLAYGPASWHVLASGGAPVNPLHFYSTTYSAVHGREGVNRQAGNVRHRYYAKAVCIVLITARIIDLVCFLLMIICRGTGYASNFRPAVFYTPRLDAVDNPVMGYACISCTLVLYTQWY